MQAETVWRVWRRILREPALSHRVLECGPIPDGDFGLAPDELSVVEAYAAQAEGSRWAVQTYQHRLITEVLYALETGAPLSRRCLEVAGCNPADLARDYLTDSHWPDNGPFVYRCCAGFLAFIEQTAWHDAVAGLADLIRLESAQIDLVRRLARRSPADWTRLEQLPGTTLDPSRNWYVQTGTGAIVTVANRLTPWLLDLRLLGQKSIEVGPEHLLTYVTSPRDPVALFHLTDAAKGIFDSLAVPRPFETLRASVRDEAAVAQLLAEFLEFGVVRTTQAD
jgi:hypothetical protein